MLPQGRHLLQRNLLQFHRRRVAAVVVASQVAGPVEVFCCSDLDVSGVPPWPARFDQSRLVQSIDHMPTGKVRCAPLPNFTNRPLKLPYLLPPKPGRSCFATLSVTITRIHPVSFMHYSQRIGTRTGWRAISHPLLRKRIALAHNITSDPHSCTESPNPSVVA